MKKLLKLTLLFTLIFVGFVFALHKTHAVTYYDSTSAGTSTIYYNPDVNATFQVVSGFQTTGVIPTGTYYAYWLNASGTNDNTIVYTIGFSPAFTDPYPAASFPDFGTQTFPAGTTTSTLITGQIPFSIPSGDYVFLGCSANGPIMPIGSCGVSGTGTVTWGSQTGNPTQYYTTSSPAFFYMGDTPYSPTPPVINPSIDFTYPITGLSTQDFQNWVINVSSTASSTNGTVSVFYGQNSSSLTFYDQAQYSAFVSSNPFVIPKSNVLNPIINITQTSTWYAEACYENPTVFSTTCSSLISFVINPQAALINSSSGVLALQFGSNPDQYLPSSSTVSSTVLLNPYSCQGTILNFSVGNCVNYFIFSVAQILFQPLTGAQNYLSSAVTNLEKTQPFAAVFDTLAAVQDNSQSAPASADLGYNLDLGSSSGTVPFLNSSTMSAAVTPAGKTELFAVEDAMFDILTLGLIFFVPWHWWRKKSHPAKTT